MEEPEATPQEKLRELIMAHIGVLFVATKQAMLYTFFINFCLGTLWSPRNTGFITLLCLSAGFSLIQNLLIHGAETCWAALTNDIERFTAQQNRQIDRMKPQAAEKRLATLKTFLPPK